VDPMEVKLQLSITSSPGLGFDEEVDNVTLNEPLEKRTTNR